MEIYPTLPKLPKKVRDMPTGAIEIANLHLQRTYPVYFGDILPPLQNSDILVSQDHHVLRWIAESDKAEVHSLRKFHQAELIQKFKFKRPHALKVWSLKETGQPIVFYEGYLSESANGLGNLFPREQKKRFLDFIFARLLIHEALHNAAPFCPPFEVNASDQIVEAASFADCVQLNLYSGEIGEVLARQMAERDALIATHPLRASIGGARIKLYVPDHDGVFRPLNGTGYDFEEGIIETLAEPVYESLYAQVAKEFSERTSKVFKETAEGTDDSYTLVSARKFIPAALENIGSTSLEDTLQRFVAGRLPQDIIAAESHYYH